MGELASANLGIQQRFSNAKPSCGFGYAHKQHKWLVFLTHHSSIHQLRSKSIV
jgi:hypothetical protein